MSPPRSGIGDLPTTLVDVRQSPHFRFTISEVEDYDSDYAVFDGLDHWLKTGPAAPALRWIEAGLDVRFDADFQNDVAASLKSNGGLERMIREHSLAWERAVNMDW